MQGMTDLNISMLDDYDLVVGHQTFAFMAVARGIPTLMMDEWQAPRNGKDDLSVVTVSSWEKYNNLVMYPLDLLTTSDAFGLMNEAIRSDEMIKDWKGGMIGDKAFDDRLVAQTIRNYL